MAKKPSTKKEVPVDRPTRPELRTFDHFPEGDTCPLCGTSDDGTCILVGIDNTQRDRIEEAQPIHVGCIRLRYHKQAGIFYQRVGE